MASLFRSARTPKRSTRLLTVLLTAVICLLPCLKPCSLLIRTTKFSPDRLKSTRLAPTVLPGPSLCVTALNWSDGTELNAKDFEYTDTFPVFACPVGIIRLFKHFQTPELTPCQIDPPTGRKLLPIAPAAFRMPCFQMGLLHGFFFPAVAPAQPVMAAAFFCLFYLPADGQASIPAPRQIFSHILHLPG